MDHEASNYSASRVSMEIWVQSSPVQSSPGIPLKYFFRKKDSLLCTRLCLSPVPAVPSQNLPPDFLHALRLKEHALAGTPIPNTHDSLRCSGRAKQLYMDS